MPPISFPIVAARVGARLGVALWHHRLALLVSGLLVGVLATVQLTMAGPSSTSDVAGDCADTTMAALTHVTDEGAHAAYACLDPAMRQGQGEDAFVRGLKARGDPPASQVTRVAERRSPNGGRVVFYSVDTRGDSVGYIVYLGPSGKVERID